MAVDGRGWLHDQLLRYGASDRFKLNIRIVLDVMLLCLFAFLLFLAGWRPFVVLRCINAFGNDARQIDTANDDSFPKFLAHFSSFLIKLILIAFN